MSRALRLRPSGVLVMALAVIVAGRQARAQQLPAFGERVSVNRLVIDARVVTDRGDPVLGLGPEDFAVKVGGRLVRVESATWIGGPPGEESGTAMSTITASDLDQPGRLIVFLIQKSLEPSRIGGLMRLLLMKQDLLGTLTARDRIAVLSFDSRLRVWTDFTNDRRRLDAIFGHDLLLQAPPPVQESVSPSLVAGLDDRALRTDAIEKVLEWIGHAMTDLPGSKSLVLIGHGFGRLTGSGMMMVNDCDAAREALVASRTAVFSLDVTDADYHSLEAGLQVVADDTGGFYARTHLFPGQAVDRLAGALAGYYVLFVEVPDGGGRSHDIDVRLTVARGRVLVTSRFADRGE